MRSIGSGVVAISLHQTVKCKPITLAKVSWATTKGVLSRLRPPQLRCSIRTHLTGPRQVSHGTSMASLFARSKILVPPVACFSIRKLPHSYTSAFGMRATRLKIRAPQNGLVGLMAILTSRKCLTRLMSSLSRSPTTILARAGSILLALVANGKMSNALTPPSRQVAHQAPAQRPRQPICLALILMSQVTPATVSPPSLESASTISTKQTWARIGTSSSLVSRFSTFREVTARACLPP